MNVSTTLQPDQFHAMDACWQPPTSPGLTGSPSRSARAPLDFAARGYRSLGVARGGGDGEWKFLGDAKKKATAEALAETSIAA